MTPSGDTFETGTRSAIAGGTTTILAFAQQQKTDMSLFPIVEDYHRRAIGNAYCDYGFHIILAEPTTKILNEELPVLVREQGITSVKLYMTYEPLKLVDRQILDVMMSTRALGMTTMVHAENSDMIDWITEKLEEKKMVDPYYHAVSRPNIAEDEATYRVISLSELMDIPILIVHMSSKAATSHVRKAQTRDLPIHAETCPHYLFLKSDRLRGEHFEGAKYVCSPPLREDQMDLDAMWQGLRNGTFTTFSSDHAASKFDHPQGKKAGLINGVASFRRIPNGLPGVETRVPILFSGGVLKDKITVQKFVELTSSNPAKLYGLNKKGTIAPGFDADLVIWYPSNKMTPFALRNDMLHHDIDYTPFEDMEFQNWPRWTILRGNVVWDRDNGGVVGKMGDGKYLRRGRSTLSKPREVFVNEFRP
ncbi:Metallo-dependent hydrolase [Neolentinus lepideus HHB14362 ss-1]|uniref:dihydropyrimidinase n=1 Tax=Neolentinus lepideus HHB14362 ss-1 TaxID=1314782 RepID=A0A165Q470_9AGAM|nr:Metallo-dependent hydrolase [Neolentinus lepideus HHB14362 ss-1]